MQVFFRYKHFFLRIWDIFCTFAEKLEVMRILSPSVLSADFGHLSSEIEMLNRSEADWIHVDVMDGVFVPNISFGFPLMKPLRELSEKPLDVHLMITHPERYVERFCDAGAWSVGFHLEAVEDPRPILDLIRRKGVRTCLTINPDIPVDRLLPYVGEVDMVLIMSVYAGFGGQSFIVDTLDKVRVLRKYIDDCGYSTLIQMDGGVTLENASLLYSSGADSLVAGSAVFSSVDPLSAIRSLKGL